MAEWAKLYNWLLKDFQVQLVGPLLFMCYTYWKMDARQKVSDEKITNVGDDVKEIKTELNGVKTTLDDHSIQIKDVNHKMELTKVELQNKWEKFTNAKGQQEGIFTEAEIYAETETQIKGQTQAEIRASQA